MPDAVTTTTLDSMAIELRLRRLDDKITLLSAEQTRTADTVIGNKLVPAVTPERRRQIEAELTDLNVLRATAVDVLEGCRQIEANRRQRTDTSRDAVAVDAERLLTTARDVAYRVDMLATDLSLLLVQFKQAIAALQPLLGEAETRRLCGRNFVTAALHRAGLGEHADLGGTAQSLKTTLKEHAEITVASTVRNEVMRLRKQKELS